MLKGTWLGEAGQAGARFVMCDGRKKRLFIHLTQSVKETQDRTGVKHYIRCSRWDSKKSMDNACDENIRLRFQMIGDQAKSVFLKTHLFIYLFIS